MDNQTLAHGTISRNICSKPLGNQSYNLFQVSRNESMKIFLIKRNLNGVPATVLKILPRSSQI